MFKTKVEPRAVRRVVLLPSEKCQWMKKVNLLSGRSMNLCMFIAGTLTGLKYHVFMIMARSLL